MNELLFNLNICFIYDIAIVNKRTQLVYLLTWTDGGLHLPGGHQLSLQIYWDSYDVT